MFPLLHPVGSERKLSSGGARIAAGAPLSHLRFPIYDLRFGRVLNLEQLENRHFTAEKDRNHNQ